MNKKTRRVIGLVIKIVVSLILVGVIAQLLAAFAFLIICGFGGVIVELFTSQIGAKILYLLFWLITSLILLDSFLFDFKYVKLVARRIKRWLNGQYQEIK